MVAVASESKSIASYRRFIRMWAGANPLTSQIHNLSFLSKHQSKERERSDELGTTCSIT